MIKALAEQLRMAAEAAAAYSITLLWYATTLLVARLSRRRRRKAPGLRRAVVIGTFHNPGWYVSHLAPLTSCGLDEVVVITHGPVPPIAGVRHEPPPSWLRVLVGRSVSKLIWSVRAGKRSKAEVFIGYHIIPNATIALIAARLLGRRACYQMTGGPIELLGGGYLATENRVLGRLRRPSRRLEHLALAVAGEFDLVVVRGRSAERFVLERAGARVAIIPGAVDLSRFSAEGAERRRDMVFVGRLAPTKQPLQFVEIVAGVRRWLPDVRASIVGDGPLKEAVTRRIAELHLQSVIDVCGQVSTASPYLRDARVFLLTSRSEGLSIAMVEAMMSGTVPVVANVGELGDLVSDGENGFLIEPGDIEQYVQRTVSVLSDASLWQRLSDAAARRARAHNGLERVSAVWREQLRALAAGLAHFDKGVAPTRGASVRPPRRSLAPGDGQQ